LLLPEERKNYPFKNWAVKNFKPPKKGRASAELYVWQKVNCVISSCLLNNSEITGHITS
jgi:hypothetical protein